MGQKLVVGPFKRGLRNDVTPFNVDNESFPVLVNAYQWRDRVKRKRGTSFLNRLTRFFDSTISSYGSTATIVLNGSGVGNILTGFGLTTFAPNANLFPGSVIITQGLNVYTDQGNGTFLPSGTLNYQTGVITIAAEAGNAVNAKFRYYPSLPVLGLEELIINSSNFTGTLGFDTKYSYNIVTSSPYNVYDVSFYKNPAASALLPGYVQKTNETATTWNGQDYQQFWSVNYQGALWATNGISEPFSTVNIGMQYNTITAVAIGSAGPPAIATITTGTNHGLSIGDFVFINEVNGITGINFQTGYVTATPALNQITVEFPLAVIAGAWTSGGIVQYLTNRSDTTKDCLRWYDGDPTNGSASAPALTGTKGWVNFCPPISFASYIVSDQPQAVYYLVGARMIVPFKDRLLFIGPVIQTSAAGSQVYLQDTIIYSQNGTPYYTVSFAGNDPSLPNVTQRPILVPTNQTASGAAYFEDRTGFGGFIQAGVEQPIVTVSSNEDILVLGFRTLQTKLVYSGNDIVPFQFFTVNSELGSGSTFSAINLDEGVIAVGSRGFTITNQTVTQRIDLEIPDEVFEFSLIQNGSERVTAQRDFINEWMYFTYLSNNVQETYKFPTQTLQYNYRDQSWAIFEESYTTYGQFRALTGFTWGNISEKFPTWLDWNEPWKAGSTTLLQPKVIAGNQQGFIIFREQGTGESNSLYVQSFTSGTITCPDHCLNEGDYITFSGALGTVGTEVNGKIFSVGLTTQDTFTLNPPILGTGTYLGLGVIKRMYVPFIQTRQFPTGWDLGRKTRLGVQQYLLSTTPNSQITLLIFLSTDADNPYNAGPIVPATDVDNDSLIFSTVLYTCPESANLGLTPANTNLQMIAQINAAGTNASSPQDQIWHRINTSLIGDTVQVGFTMSDTQMRDTNFTNQFAEIELHGMILDISPSGMLA